MPQIIFFNIGWMKEYRGETAEDKVISNFGYVVEHGTGHEQYNFLPLKSSMFGYAPLPWNYERGEPNSLRIERLGASKNDESISGVTAVFFSKHPFKRDARIVGWYKNATLHRVPQVVTDSRRILKDGESLYYVEANEKNCTCLPEEKRNFLIPTRQERQGGYGQSSVWYADQLPEFQKEVLRYIENYSQAERTTKGNKSGFTLSTEDKKKIETTAVKTTATYYQKEGYTVISREKDNCGWDLTVTKDNEEFYVEVKGTARSTISFQLTPNEYSTLKKHNDKYRIATVRNCFTTPELEIFTMSKISHSKNSLYEGISAKGTKIYLAERTETYAIATF